MSKREQRWRPDTCQCVLIQEIDDETGEITGKPDRSHPNGGKCAAHKNVADARLHDVILSENQAKNMALAHAKEHSALNVPITPEQKLLLGVLWRASHPGHHDSADIPDSVLHPDIALSHEFDSDRNLTIHVIGGPSDKLPDVESHLKSRHAEVFGADHRFHPSRIRVLHKDKPPRP